MVIIIGCFIFWFWLFLSTEKDDDKLIESNNSTKLNQDKSHEKNHYH
ncbi:hypothetical protein SEEACDC3_15494 [Salmonella enterica subsp. enterica serovar Agona str. SA-3]|nr:hypothetical protein SEEACDC3_15494 [Salmonella enterica subsp. enterica serovar Agona str. SA-3]